jgi:hypothetical protein
MSGLVVVVSLCGLVVVAIVIVAVVSVVFSFAFVVAVVIDLRRRPCLHCCCLLSMSWWRSNAGAAMGAAMAKNEVVQRW